MDNIERVGRWANDKMMEVAQRANRRYAYETDILHDVVLSDSFYNGKIYNFSNDGVYFESNEQILVGDEISITITKISQKDFVDIQKFFDVEILWRKNLRSSSFQYGYGAKLIRPKGSLIKLFGRSKLENIYLDDHDRKDEIDEKDPRTHPRKIYNEMSNFVCRKQIHQGLVTNISRGGAFIETKKRFSFGEKITLIIPRYETRKDIKLKGWIVRLDETGFGIKIDLTSGRKRICDLDRRVNINRRKRLGPEGWSQNENIFDKR